MYNMVRRFIEVYILVKFGYVFVRVPVVLICTCKSGLDASVILIRRFDPRVCRLFLYMHTESVLVEIVRLVPALIKQGV